MFIENRNFTDYEEQLLKQYGFSDDEIQSAIDAMNHCSYWDEPRFIDELVKLKNLGISDFETCYAYSVCDLNPFQVCNFAFGSDITADEAAEILESDL